MLNLALKSTQSFSVENGVKIMVYGRAGRGKTRLCSTCPNPVVISAESGLLSLAQYNLPYYEVKTVADLRDVYNWAKSSQQARQFQTICIDSITDIAETYLAAAKAGAKDPRQSYGKMIDDMTGIIKDFRDLPRFHIYMTVKQDRIQDANGVVMNGPGMPGKVMGQAMPYFPDEVFKIDKTDPSVNGPGYHYLQCQPTFSDEGKDRSGVLDMIERPDLSYIINKITRGINLQK